jgi:putative ABC transport system permease protein
VIAIFVGVAVISPVAVRGVTALFGWPMRKIAGVAGRLAQKNAARNPRRTATTRQRDDRSALVTTALVVGRLGEGDRRLDVRAVAKADYYLTDDLDEVDFPASLATSSAVRASPPRRVRRFDARVDGTVTGVVGFDFDQIDALLDLDVRAGSFDRSVVHPVVVSVDEAKAIVPDVGDATRRRGCQRIPRRRDRSSGCSTTRPSWARTTCSTPASSHVRCRRDAEWLAVSITRAPRRRPSTRSSPACPSSSRTRRRDRASSAAIEGMVDQVLTMVNVMVALAVVIALIGIANTLALSVFERTRELGLVRAVGMTRRQLRRMVRYEAALVATFGATRGVGLGLLFGFGVVTALPASFAAGFSVRSSRSRS